MNHRLFSLILLFFIFSITIFTRFYRLTTLPPALFSDEVDAGYQAMVFNNSGSDYFGNFLPTHFQSFSDWRTSAYIYSIALSLKITHNPELSVRLPSAIFSCLSVFVFLLITKSAFATFLLAISPWSIHFGRTGFEVSGMLLTILFGIYFWQKYLSSLNSRYLIFVTFFFCLSPYFYSTAKLFLPLILLTILLVWYKVIIKISPKLIIGLICLALFFLTPFIIDTVKGNAGFRFNYISIFTEPHREQTTDQLRYEDIYSDNIGVVGVATPPASFLFHNKYELILERFISNYFSAFSTEFLFQHGDSNLRQGFGNHGMLYLIDFFFLLSGLLIYFKNPTLLGKFFFVLLILSPIPYALTRDSLSAHSTRLILMLPSLIYFISLNRSKLLYPLYILFFFNFWHYYSLHYPQNSAPYWHTNMKEAVISSQSSNLPTFYSDKDEPFLPFFLFYSQYLPQNRPITGHLTHVFNPNFDGQTLDNKYYFGHINWTSLPSTTAVYVISKSEFQTLSNQSQFEIVDFIPKKYLNSQEFYILKPAANVTKNK